MRRKRTVKIRSLVIITGLLIFPRIEAIPFSIITDANRAAFYAIVAVSLVILTGWLGQISLAQASFVGIGAFATGAISRKFGVQFPVTLIVSVLISGAAAALLGVVALRVRGLYLAVATLIFSWMADAYLFNAPWFVGVGGSSSIRAKSIGFEGGFPYFDLSDRRTFYYVSIACAVFVLYAAANVRDSRTGRAFFAIRGSEVAAASLGIDVTRYKLIAFALSGFVAGAAGNLIMTFQRTVVPADFSFTYSLFYLSMAVVGGLTSLSGAVAASLLFAGLDELFRRVTAFNGYLDVASGVLLATMLLAYRSGLAGVPESLRPQWQRLKTLVEQRLGRLSRGLSLVEDRMNLALASLSRSIPWGRKEVAENPVVVTSEQESIKSSSELPLSPQRQDRELVLEVKDVSVRFGGLIAVNKVSLEVRKGEIVGLIGPNGAGKTTTFNAISGLNVPEDGKVLLGGEDVTDAPVHIRAQKGMARTFQVIQLFSQLSVRQNLLVATHAHNRSGIFSNIFVTRRSILAELDARSRVQEVIEMLDLQDLADRPVAGLPFGSLRMIEFGRALVTGASLVMLDEPASGLDNSETDRLSRLLTEMRDSLGISLLLIEHDVRMVTQVSDYMYVIERGTPLAEGEPEVVQRDPSVIAAYLGQVQGAAA